jgi:hypothetical protein
MGASPKPDRPSVPPDASIHQRASADIYAAWPPRSAAPGSPKISWLRLPDGRGPGSNALALPRSADGDSSGNGFAGWSVGILFCCETCVAAWSSADWRRSGGRRRGCSFLGGLHQQHSNGDGDGTAKIPSTRQGQEQVRGQQKLLPAWGPLPPTPAKPWPWSEPGCRGIRPRPAGY